MLSLPNPEVKEECETELALSSSGVVEVGSAVCARAAALSQAPMIVNNANVATRPLLLILLNVISLASSNPRN